MFHPLVWMVWIQRCGSNNRPTAWFYFRNNNHRSGDRNCNLYDLYLGSLRKTRCIYVSERFPGRSGSHHGTMWCNRCTRSNHYRYCIRSAGSIWCMVPWLCITCRWPGWCRSSSLLKWYLGNNRSWSFCNNKCAGKHTERSVLRRWIRTSRNTASWCSNSSCLDSCNNDNYLQSNRYDNWTSCFRGRRDCWSGFQGAWSCISICRIQHHGYYRRCNEWKWKHRSWCSRLWRSISNPKSSSCTGSRTGRCRYRNAQSCYYCKTFQVRAPESSIEQSWCYRNDSYPGYGMWYPERCRREISWSWDGRNRSSKGKSRSYRWKYSGWESHRNSIQDTVYRTCRWW